VLNNSNDKDLTKNIKNKKLLIAVG
jgi:hypothetical protein